MSFSSGTLLWQVNVVKSSPFLAIIRPFLTQFAPNLAGTNENTQKSQNIAEKVQKSVSFDVCDIAKSLNSIYSKRKKLTKQHLPLNSSIILSMRF